MELPEGQSLPLIFSLILVLDHFQKIVLFAFCKPLTLTNSSIKQTHSKGMNQCCVYATDNLCLNQL